MITVIAWLAFAILSFQIIAQFVFSLGLRRLPRPSAHQAKDTVPLSVIIAVKDEASNLNHLLSNLIHQKYPEYEIVLVDDGSVDQSLEIMHAFAVQHDHIQVIKTSEQHHQSLGGKKGALQTGIDHARYDHLVFTDGDCEPLGEHWLTTYGRYFSRGKEVIVGTGFYQLGETWFGGIYSMDAVRSAMMYHSLAGLGMPYMCVGRSLGYTKQAFSRADGFLRHADLLTGSDDLLLQSFPKGTSIQSAPSALTLSDPPPSLKVWVQQRKRHLGAAPRYKMPVRGFLTAYDISLLCVPFVLIWGAFQKHDILIWVVGLFALRSIWSAINLQGIINLSGRPEQLVQVWPWEYPASWMNALISVASLWAKEKEWKISR